MTKCRSGSQPTLALIASVLAAPGALAADADSMIEEALSAAPPQVRETAKVQDFEGNVLREGDGPYTCFPAPEGIAGPMCMDETFMTWMQAWQKSEEPEIDRVGVSYMLAGDSASGGASNVDPAAQKPTADNEWVVEGPHIMIISPDPAMLEGLPTTPVEDGPYVMWSGTPYAHVMVPVGDRGEQRTPE